MTLVAGGATVEPADLDLRVLAGRCDGCARCVGACPTGALWLDVSRWLVEGDAGRCVGCRRCERTCPAGAISVSGPVPIAAGGGTASSPWDEAVAQSARCLACPEPPCELACPAHLDVLGLVAAVHEHDVAMATAILERAHRSPSSCTVGGDVAPACERACTWALAGGEPVAIGRIERAVAERRPDLAAAGRGAPAPSTVVVGRS